MALILTADLNMNLANPNTKSGALSVNLEKRKFALTGLTV